MKEFRVHTLETAPEKSKAALMRLQTAVGVIPNLAATMAESTVLIGAFEAIRAIFHNGTFSPPEREVLSLTNAIENKCAYCVAIHSLFALKVGVDQNVVDSIRANIKPDHPRFGPLFVFTKRLIRQRGNVELADLESFLSAGFTEAQALEVVVGLAASVLANYSHHLTRAPLDNSLTSQIWKAPEAN